LLNVASHTRTLLSAELIAAILWRITHQIAERSSTKSDISAIASSWISALVVVRGSASIRTEVTVVVGSVTSDRFEARIAATPSASLERVPQAEHVTHLVCDCVEISADDARTNCHDEIDGRIATPREASFTVDDAVSCRGILGDENVNVARTSKTSVRVVLVPEVEVYIAVSDRVQVGVSDAASFTSHEANVNRTENVVQNSKRIRNGKTADCVNRLRAIGLRE
jgi:hypothetical protein